MPEDKNDRTCYVDNDCEKCSQNKNCSWAFRDDIKIKKIGPRPTDN